MKAEKMPEWLKKCITCKYAYKKKDDDDCIYCRRMLGECKYEAYKEKSDGQTNWRNSYGDAQVFH